MYSCLTPKFLKNVRTSNDLNDLKLSLTNNEGVPRRDTKRFTLRINARHIRS